MTAIGLRQAPRWFVRMVSIIVLALAVVMVLAPLRADAQDLDKPMLLVATPALQGSWRGTVILAAPIAGTHVGVILNRPTKLRLGQLFPEHAASARVTTSVYFGGPEARDSIFALVRGAQPDPTAIAMGPGLWLAHRGDVVDMIIESQGDAARYFVGFVGWRLGELTSELERGAFVVRPFDPAKVFLPDTRHLHEELAPKKGQVGV